MKKTRTSGIQRRKPQLMALEPRLMFDGAAVATTDVVFYERVMIKVASPATATPSGKAEPGPAKEPAAEPEKKPE